ncbi:TonB-dependent receptor [Phenylobacterium montanum]|uniref:TonB-dependent receptor n=1 Tax=Phenylobacterium montanum TaxID=2823693 RepID=A0A975G0H7_9CAUL|nr:TonB-dependent receptor [Caulobacter sp. S6]QUD88850.1 TonB-dependent receptor [Caulobacter sp. S6]
MIASTLRSRRGAHLLLAGVSSLAVTFAAGAALAQTAPAAQASAAPATDEVVVTASRREERDMDVPVAVSAVSGQKLDVLNSSGLDIRFLSAKTPSLIVESSFGRTYPRFYIRGLGNTDFDINAAQPVSVVYDDVALESPLLKAFPVFDLSGVDVLRGPQGTLFGRNTPAGVVKLDSAKPTDSFGGYGSLSYGSFNTVNAEGAVNQPLGDGFSARLSALVEHRDNWVHNTATGPLVFTPHKLEGYTDIAARLQIAYDNGGPFTALLNIHGRDLDGTPRVFRAGAFQPGSNNFAPGFDVYKVALDGPSAQTLRSGGIDLHLNYKFAGLGVLHSITAFEAAKVRSVGDIDGGANYVGFPATGLNNALFWDATGDKATPKEFSQELRFETEQFGKWRGQVGLYYFNQRLTYDEIDYAQPTLANPRLVIDSTVGHLNHNENFGAFASVEYKATDALTVRGGLRYSNDDKNDKIWGNALFPAVPVQANGNIVPVTTKVSGDNVSGDLSATYVVTPHVNLYARVATGYLGPAIQDRVNFGSVPDTARNETTTSGEIGVKAQLFDRRVHIDFDIYANETKDLQLTAVGGAVNSAALLNAKKVVGNGVETDIQARPIDNLTLTAGVSHNFTKIEDGTISVAPCGAGNCTVTDPLNAQGNAILNGNPLPQAPQWVANWTARYGIPMANGGEVFAYTDWSYRSELNYFLYTAKEFTSRPELQGGLRVGYLTPRKTEFAVFVRNITNQIRAESAIDFNNLTGMVNDPITWGVAVKSKF